MEPTAKNTPRLVAQRSALFHEMRTGRHGEYWWLESASLDLCEFLQAFPQALLGLCVAVASFDSGPLEPTPEGSAAGWIYRDGIAYIPCVADAFALPYDDYDEWYVLNEVRDIAPLDTFVNYLGFGLSDPESRGGERDATWDLVGWRHYCDAERARQTLFWEQVARINPEACLLNGNLFVAVTRDRALHEAAVRWHG